MTRRNLALALIVAIALVGCRKSPPEETAGGTQRESTLTVYTVNYPLQYFAERIGGEHVQVHFPAPADEDPAYWSPEADTIANYQQADLILANGAGYAKWIDKVSLPSARLVNTSAALADKVITLEGAVTHSHGPEGEHEHGETAFTTWLDPTLAIEQARAVRAAFEKARPQHAVTFRTNFAALQKDLQAVDEKLAALAASASDTPLLFSHPVYQYLTRRYNLNARSVHWEPDQVPDAAMWDELKQLLGEHPAKWMIWEGEPLDTVVARLTELGVGSVVFDPCGGAPDEGDYLSVMESGVENLSRACAPQP